MARIRINLPEVFTFSTDIEVRNTDINQGGHMGWNYMFHILDEARVRFWQSIDYSETDNGSFSNIMVDAGVNYKQQVYYGQTLRVEIAVADMNDKGFDLVYKVSDAKTGIEAARAKTGILCFNYAEQKIAPIPDNFREKLLGEK